MEENIEYRSGITGRAQVRFGGRIHIGVGYSPDTKVGGIGLHELKEEYQVGADLPKNPEQYDEQVTLVFNNLESIEIVRDALDMLETAFKYGDFKK